MAQACFFFAAKNKSGLKTSQNQFVSKNDYLCRNYHIGIVPTSTKSELASNEKLSMQEMWHID